MRRTIAKLALSVAMLMGAAGPACADPATFTARITNLLFFEQGDLVYIYVEGGTRDRPACAGSNGDYISFKMSRPRAKEYIAGLMMAFAAGKTVSFRTEGACIDQSVSDTLTYFTVNDQ